MSDAVAATTAPPEDEVQPSPLPAAAAPFARPLSEVLGQAAEEDEEEGAAELDDLEEPAEGRSSSAAPKPEASSKAGKGKVPGRGGGGGPKMRKGQVERLTKAKGPKTTPQEWAEILKAEAKKACDAAGVPLAESSQAPSDSAPSSAAGVDSQAEACGGPTAEDAGPTGHKFTPSEDEERIYGQPAGQVLEAMHLTGGFWGMIAKRSEGTRWDFSGEREMDVFPGTPFARTIRCNSERRLAELSAVLLVKHGSKVTGKVDSPEALFAGTLFFAFGPQAVEGAWGMVQKIGGWLKRRRGGA
jgi:hypothetical protein